MDFLQAVNRFRQRETSNPDTNTLIITKTSRKINVQFITNSPAPLAGDQEVASRPLRRLPLRVLLSALSGGATDADITNKDPVRPRNQPRDIRLAPTTERAVNPSGCSGFPVRYGLLGTPDRRRIGGRRRIQNLRARRHTRGTDSNTCGSGIEGVRVGDSLITKHADLPRRVQHRVIPSF